MDVHIHSNVCLKLHVFTSMMCTYIVICVLYCVCVHFTVGLYSDDYNGALMLLTGISNGVTHLMISDDGKLLHTGFRKVQLLICTYACMYAW